MTDQPSQPAGATNPTDAIERVERSLLRLGARARLALGSQRAALTLASVITALLALAAADYLLHLPSSVRWFNLLVGVVALAGVVWRIITPAFRLRPSLATLALRVESHHPDLAGVLASGVELDTSKTPGVSSFEQSLARRVVAQAASRFSDDDLKGLIRRDQLGRSLIVLAMVLASATTIAAFNPTLTTIGARRALAPWTNAHWPKRTIVAGVTDQRVHAQGAALPLQASLIRSSRPIDRTDVFVEYRPVNNDKSGQTQRELMTWQSRDVVTGAGDVGALFERLIDTDSDAIKYRFVTLDDRTDWRQIRLVPPPAIVSAAAVITPPDYAADLVSTGPAAALTQRTELDLGDGADERAIAPTTLAGSTIDLELTFNKNLSASPADPDWVAETFSVAAANANVSIEQDPQRANVWRLAWTLDASLRLPVTLVDEFGIESTAESVFRFQSVQDRPASAAVTQPSADMTALATAVLHVVGEGRDDVGLASLRLDQQRARPAGAEGGEPSGPGGAIEPMGDPISIANADAAGERTIEVKTTLDLAPMGLRPGDQLWLTAVAEDVYAMAGAHHEPTRSLKRVVRIITQTEFIQEVRSELSSIRQGAIRLHEDQQKLRDLDPQSRASDLARRGQSQLSDRIARLGEQAARIEQRVNENALNDRQLENVLDDAEQFVAKAGQWSTKASDRLQQADANKNADQPGAEKPGANKPDAASPQEKPLDPEAQRQLDDAQQRVQDELAGLADLLDTGEDAWVAKRQLEDLLNKQTELAEQTAKAGRQTAGKAANELTPAQRTELQRIVDKQLELAKKAQELADDLEQRARDLAEHDPAAASGMRQAARRARESQVSQKMQDAAKKAEQNRMADAGDQQQQAAEDLQEMLNDLDDAENSREEVLRRVLASLIESLGALINQQRTEIDALAQGVVHADFTDLDQGMIRLNQNTLGVLDQASAAGRELASVADIVGRAVEAQTQSILALRDAPVDAPRADEQERRSLELLEQARDEAEKIDQQMKKRQQDRARKELRQAYRDALEQEVALRRQTIDFAAIDKLDRRQRASLRKLGQQQSDIQKTLNELLEKSKDITDAGVFQYAHHRLDDVAGQSADALGAADAHSAVPPENIAVALLQGLVEALKDSKPKQDDFNTGGGGGGGGGGSGDQPLIPPIAELRLLKQIQTDLARRTRSLDDAGADAASAQSLGQEQQDLQELGVDLVRRMKKQSQSPAPQGRHPQ